MRSAAGLIIAPLPDCPESDIIRLEQLTGKIAKLSQHMDDGETLESALNALSKAWSLKLPTLSALHTAAIAAGKGLSASLCRSAKTN